MAQVPTLTALDRRVLASLPGPDAPGLRILDTFKAPANTLACPRHGRRYRLVDCVHCGKALDVIADAYEEHCEVLRGLERVGLASCRGGWWRRV